MPMKIYRKIALNNNQEKFLFSKTKMKGVQSFTYLLMFYTSLFLRALLLPVLPSDSRDSQDLGYRKK